MATFAYTATPQPMTSQISTTSRDANLRPIEKEAQAVFHGASRDQISEGPQVLGPMAAMNQTRCILAQLELAILH